MTVQSLTTVFCLFAAIAIMVVCFVYFCKIISSLDKPVAYIPVEVRPATEIVKARIYNSMSDHDKLKIQKAKANQRLLWAILLVIPVILAFIFITPIGGAFAFVIWVKYVIRTGDETTAINNATSIDQISI